MLLFPIMINSHTILHDYTTSGTKSERSFVNASKIPVDK